MKIRFCSTLAILLLVTAGSFGQTPEEQQDHIRKRWNKSLVHDPDYPFNKDANNLLKQTITDLPPGRALDVAMGQGRNLLYLASMGWDVTGFDLADEAVSYAEEMAAANNLEITTIISDMEEFDYGENQWDLITWIYGGCLDVDRIAERIKTALKSGGIFLFEFFHRDAGVAMGRPSFGCETDAVKNKFIQAGGFKIMRYEEKEGIADFGLEPFKLIYFVAMKE